MEASSLYVHLVPQNHGVVKESFKLVVNGQDTVSELSKQIYTYLEKRNDGNKVYRIVNL
jgi:hypothetical protein